MVIFLLVLELILLYRLSIIVHNYIYFLLTGIARNRNIALWVYSILFLPGTIVHELSHFLMATILFVKTGDIKLIPEFQDTSLKLGEIAVAKADPIRRFLIGVAPIMVGLIIIIGSIYFISSKDLVYDWRVIIITSYIVFIVGNTMFSSKKDLEESWKFFVIISAIVIAIFILKIPFGRIFEILSYSKIQEMLSLMSKYLLIPLCIDLVIVILFRFNRR